MKLTSNSSAWQARFSKHENLIMPSNGKCYKFAGTTQKWAARDYKDMTTMMSQCKTRRGSMQSSLDTSLEWCRQICSMHLGYPRNVHQTMEQCARHQCNSNIFKCCSLRLKQRHVTSGLSPCPWRFDCESRIRKLQIFVQPNSSA